MMFFDFDWDANKARANLKKHGVSFRLAASVFRDPLALTLFDEAHSDDERWITLGRTQNGQTLVAERAHAGGGAYQREHQHHGVAHPHYFGAQGRPAGIVRL